MFSVLHQRKKLKGGTVRKIIHLSAAPLMIVTWPLYTSAWHSRAFASVVPISFALRMIRSSQSDPLCTSVSRSGDHAESRFGPGSYCVSVAGLILIFWRSDPATYFACGMMVFGDAFANILGSAIKGPQWPIPKTKKSVVGSLSFVFVGACATKGLLKFAEVTRMCDAKVSWQKVFIVAVVSAAAELAPLQDNFTVPITAAGTANVVP